jgi:iron complex outermembrane receptor protein
MVKRTRISIAISAAFGASLAGYLPGTFAQQEPIVQERIEITGSILRRVQAETALPVTIITSEELAKQGVTSAEQAVARIAANQSAVGVSQSVGATTGGKAEADLRGLGTNGAANKTLVLLNGRRLANSAIQGLEGSVDLNAIPLAAIARIEVLRDGASAIYGTDAIGGVINFILRRDFTGVEVSAETQIPQKSGGEENRFTLLGGFGDLSTQRFNILGSIDYRKQDVLEAVQRDFSKTGILHGDVVSGTSGTSFPGDLGGFEPSLPNCNPPSSIPNPAGTACRYDFTRDIDIIPENEQITGLLRGTLGLGESHLLSAEYLRAQTKALQHVAPSPVNNFMPDTHPNFPAGATVINVPGFGSGGIVNWRQVPAGKRTSESEGTYERWLAELQGNTAGWEYRGAFGQSKVKNEEFVRSGYLDDDIIQAGLLNNLINPFGPQSAADQAAIDAAQLNAMTVEATGDVKFVDARVSKDLFQLPAGPVAGAVGAEYREEEYKFVATDINAVLINTLGIDPDSDVSGSRDVTALYAEFAVPILKDLDLTLAGRYDRYSDFGNTFNPKISVRFQPTQQLLLRGSFNRGFRAPTLYEIYQPFSLTFTSDNYDDPVLCPGGVAVPGASPGVVCGQQVLQRLSGPASVGLGASALQPEKSKTYTFGVVFEPIQMVSVGVDFWWIRLSNQIQALQEQAIFGDTTKYAARFTRCSQLPAGPIPGEIDRTDIDVCLNFPNFDPIAYIDTPNENLGKLNTNGVDLNLGLRFPTGTYGSIGVTLDGTYVDKFEYQREVGGEYIQNAGRYADNAPVFRWQHILAATWTIGPWSVLLANRYKDGYTDQDPAFEVDAYSTFDTSVTWTGIKNLTVTAGIKNILDEDPPQTVQVTTFQRGYDPRFTDPRGRTYTLRVAYKFF